jgi:transcriptional regulator with XRE-family HTH domain
MIVRLKSRVLEEHLLRSNISRRDFAQSVRVSGGYLAQLLTGKRKPSGRVREQLMTASGIGFDDLFQIVVEEKNHLEIKDHANV